MMCAIKFLFSKPLVYCIYILKKNNNNNNLSYFIPLSALQHKYRTVGGGGYDNT